MLNAKNANDNSPLLVDCPKQKICDSHITFYRTKRMLNDIFSLKQMVDLRQAVSLAAPLSFTIILNSNEAHGRGFQTVRFGGPREWQGEQ